MSLTDLEAFAPSLSEDPIRAELFGVERLEEHARSLAAAQEVTPEPCKGRNLLPRVRENAQVLLAAYRSIATTVRAKGEITPEAEWLLDNFHIVEEQVWGIRHHLPGSYYRLLPKIAKGHLAGCPRVYGLAWAYVAHTDSRFELETLRRYVRAYQSVQVLTIGELWAVAIHLRVALVENLRRLSQLIVYSRAERAKADELSDRLLGLSGPRPKNVKEVLACIGETAPSRPFAVQLVQRLRDHGPSILPALTWLNARLREQGSSAEDMVSLEHHAQAAANVSFRNIITSMRWMSSIDWTDFFESVSTVDDLLRAAPGFAAFDFETRNEYRAQIELLARSSPRDEIEVARSCVSWAQEAAARHASSPDRAPSEGLLGVPERAEEDPGYYLVSRGRPAFERSLGFRVPWRLRLSRIIAEHATSGFLGTIVLLTSLLLLALLYFTRSAGASPVALVVLGILGLVPASEIAVTLVHRLIPSLLRPKRLPKLELAAGVPSELRTLVVVPMLLTSLEDIESMVDRLEVHYLANPRGYLHFALLSDWVDAPAESMPEDAERLAVLVEGIARLNAIYAGPPGAWDRFFVFHRRRLWNERAGLWIGWERKRGKLHELNRLLRGARDTTFIGSDGQSPLAPPDVRYVITLDADTRLPKDSAYRLVGAAAHPLNRPRFDAEQARVVEGYAVLQPRITPSLPTGPASSVYQRIISGPGGVDPYAAATSDVYQDLFEEGSYTGKGIYDVDAFEEALEGRVPENSLLSHDLFEGLFARAGLLSDVDLFEEFPSNYEQSARRLHRWARGDWQLLPWLLGRARDGASRKPRGGIPALGRWKIVDNLRRSLVAPFSFAVAVAGWSLPLAPPLVWTGLMIGALGATTLISVLDGLLPRRWGISKRSHLRAVGHDISVALSKTFLAVTMLAHQAWLMTDAMVRTLGRLYLTKRNLLEWVTAAQAAGGVDLRLQVFYWRLRHGLVLAVGAGALFVVCKPSAWPVAGPFVLLWILAPALAWRMSLPTELAKAHLLSDPERRSLRLIARSTWRFFEKFVDQESHSLPPDNFQEDPEPVVAQRTSPTNLGLYLLSTTVAHDFGWIGILEMTDRLEATFESMGKLRRVRGHFCNWYDTGDLRALEPVYVSTVDSGNLAGHLIALAQTCRELEHRKGILPESLEGVRDALELMLESVNATQYPERTQTVTVVQLREAAESLASAMDPPPTSERSWLERLELLEREADNLLDIARTLASDGSDSDVLYWAGAIWRTIRSQARDMPVSGLEAEKGLERRLSALAALAEVLVQEMDFGFLFDSSRGLFSIGYRVADGALDPSSYDLLASEARLASFIAIAKGDVPPRHWFLLGRSLTPVGRGAALVSWSGSMFEYLMPLIVMHQPAQSLLDLTCRLVVAQQIRYGAERGVPWGVSESAYNVRDVHLTYQYRDFGVPGLGLKRGLFEDVVVAPYATGLAAMVNARAALSNFTRLEEAGGRGRYGFFEALDYTPSRLPEGDDLAVVRAYMAHHQGMILVSLGNVVHGGLTQRQFHAHPFVQAAELLLQERTPRAVAVTRPRGEEVREAALVRDLIPATLRRFDSPHDDTPRTHLLSNGRYSVMMTAAGAGYSRWQGQAVTRWREDSTRDCWGTFVYLRDPEIGSCWSGGFQPTGVQAEDYDVVYTEDRVKIFQRHRSLATALEVVVSPEDDAEIRRLTVTNLESRERPIDVTSYAEVVLTRQAADEAHPAFSNLFVATEFVPHLETLLAHRRPRSVDEPSVWLAHLATIEGTTRGSVQYETDRARFLGRGRSVRAPLSIVDGGPLSDTVGTVLDPILSLRYCLVLPAEDSAHVTFTTLAASSREEALEKAEKYRQVATFGRESSLAWTQAQIQLHHLRISQQEAHLFQGLANRLIFNDATLRAAPQIQARNRCGAPGLWPYGISGDLPIVLVRTERAEEREVIRQLVRAHEYWHLKGLSTDLVILNEEGSSYAQGLQEDLEGVVEASQSSVDHDQHAEHGSIKVLRADHLPREARLLLRAAARAEIQARHGSLAQQFIRPKSPRTRPTPTPPPRPREMPQVFAPALAVDLDFFNGLGGFSPDGREYVTILGKGQHTPAPWINVIANPSFGFQVSESGSGHTWSENSRENKLTPWSNDPISDTPGETFYVRDEETGQLWGPTSLPIRDEESPYVIRHGQGYSRFEHTAHGIALRLLQLVPLEDSIKISRLTLENRSGRRRRLSVTAYLEWVLGVSRTTSASHVVTDSDPATQALFARNPWSGEFANRTAFADLGGRQSSWTCDRREFLGRNASPDRPASLEPGVLLSGRVGAGLDPCAALRTEIELGPGQTTHVLLLLGEASGPTQARSLIHQYRANDCEEILAQVGEFWDRLLGTTRVVTPSPAMDLLLNRWLLYQTLTCRIWARSAFYQSGGAYGFRDQLQDVMALMASAPEIAREQILRAAARQFEAGDVQHWWHPPTGRGVRTRISDDRLWLPHVVARYLAVTGDRAVLDVEIPWLDGRELAENEQEAYFEPTATEETATLWEHCARALDCSLEVGAHGLPLMGAGDWNDGMNRVGVQGRGESVWMGWFLIVNLKEQAEIAESRSDDERAGRWRQVAEALSVSLERDGWDGSWYRRAFFDDGTPLGSAKSEECQIDSISQSWAVLSGVADEQRARQAMESVDEMLVDRHNHLMLLFAPPFDRTPLDPGYIKSYLPGVRENGGQYTHAAVWSVAAWAELGDGDRAFELFEHLNPILRTSGRAALHRYKVEPYAIAADVYSQAPHVGRGGWTWYTGAAGWLHRAGLEWILGFRREGERLRIDPCIPKDWKRFEIHTRQGETPYRILVENPRGVSRGVSRISLDGEVLPPGSLIPLNDDGREHRVEVELG